MRLFEKTLINFIILNYNKRETNFLMTAFSLTLFVAAVYACGAAIDNSVKELRKAFLIGLINIILLACGICSDILPWGCVLYLLVPFGSWYGVKKCLKCRSHE